MTCCDLCNNNYDLQDSHIIPGFLLNWLIKTSATGFIRSTEQPNRRIQDGWKLVNSNCKCTMNSTVNDFMRRLIIETFSWPII